MVEAKDNADYKSMFSVLSKACSDSLEVLEEIKRLSDSELRVIRTLKLALVKSEDIYAESNEAEFVPFSDLKK